MAHIPIHSLIISHHRLRISHLASTFNSIGLAPLSACRYSLPTLQVLVTQARTLNATTTLQTQGLTHKIDTQLHIHQTQLPMLAPPDEQQHGAWGRNSPSQCRRTKTTACLDKCYDYDSENIRFYSKKGITSQYIIVQCKICGITGGLPTVCKGVKGLYIVQYTMLTLLTDYIQGFCSL